MNNARINDQKVLEAARENVTAMVATLAQHLPPMVIFDALMGQVVGIARHQLGDAVAQKYFERMAEEIGRDRRAAQ